MTELLFGLTVFFVTYAVCRTLRSRAGTQTAAPAAPATSQAPTVATPAAPAAESGPPPEDAGSPRTAGPEPVEEVAEVTTSPAEESAAPEPVPASAEAPERGLRLRNPDTGEVSPVPGNYRFAKKWIKEALVAEGLLDRIYKSNELDEAASGKVKEAIDKLKMLDKYQP